MSDADVSILAGLLRVPRPTRHVEAVLAEVLYFAVRRASGTGALSTSWTVASSVRRHGEIVIDLGAPNFFPSAEMALRHALQAARAMSAHMDVDHRARVAVEALDGTTVVFFEGRRLATRPARESQAA